MKADKATALFDNNDKGIAHVINDLSNPLPTAWKARTLPLSYARLLSGILRGTSTPSQEIQHLASATI